MKFTRLVACCVVALLGVTLASAQSLVTVYSHDFETLPGPEWSNRDRDITPIGDRTFLGRFWSEPVMLELHNLPEHCSVTISFELFVIDSWEGSIGFNAGPDIWDLNVSSGPPSECPLENLLHTTFANCVCDYQAYPERFPNVHNPGLTDADEIDTLGYQDDSVYYLSFTFFHDESDLYFTFQGSPDLQPLKDETWGLDNVVVQMDTDERFCCRAQRSLPLVYGAGFPVEVAIDVSPDPRSQAHVIQETAPQGWTVSNIDNGGVWDGAAGLIRWGPFMDTQHRTLSYTAVPPIGASGSHDFSGIISVDGESEPLCGDTTVVPGGYHPADLNTNWRIGPNEFTALAAAWMQGDPWTNDPHPITADLVTNAGMLWRSGRTYLYDPSRQPPWVPAGGWAFGGGKAAGMLSSVGSGEIEVEVLATPQSAGTTYAVEDSPPAGWSVDRISHSGHYDAETGSVRWGPFVDGQARTLTYVASPSEGENAGVFAGIVSFDGAAVTISGLRGIDSVSNERPND